MGAVVRQVAPGADEAAPSLRQVPAHFTARGLQPFNDAGLCRWDGPVLEIPPGGLPYARTMAALFDPYRSHSPRRFSSAV